MVILLDIALAVLVLTAALFLGATAIALIKVLNEKPSENKKDEDKSA